MASDFELWTEFFEDDRMVALLNGKWVVNHPDGTWEVSDVEPEA